MSKEGRMAGSSKGKEETASHVIVFGYAREKTQVEVGWDSGAVGPGGSPCR